MLNIIIIDNRHGISTGRLDITDMFKYLVEIKKYHQIDITEIIDKSETEMNNIFINKFGKSPDNIILFLTKFTKLNILNILISIKINIIIDEIHQSDEDKLDKIIELKKCTRIFSTYAYIFNKFYTATDIGNIPVYFFPHSARYTSEFNNDPTIKILVSGRLNENIYPFRQMMYKMSKTNKLIDYLPVNFGYRIKEDNPLYIYGQRYVNHLNKYLVCFTCEANENRPYILRKNFEIAASGALLLAGNPISKKYLEELGFIDNEHYISVTTDNIDEKIKYVLDANNRLIIDRIRKNGYELVKSKHLYTHRGDFLDGILEV